MEMPLRSGPLGKLSGLWVADPPQLIRIAVVGGYHRPSEGVRLARTSILNPSDTTNTHPVT